MNGEELIRHRRKAKVWEGIEKTERGKIRMKLRYGGGMEFE